MLLEMSRHLLDVMESVEREMKMSALRVPSARLFGTNVISSEVRRSRDAAPRIEYHVH